MDEIKKRVLVVEDELLMSEIVANKLKLDKKRLTLLPRKNLI